MAHTNVRKSIRFAPASLRTVAAAVMLLGASVGGPALAAGADAHGADRAGVIRSVQSGDWSAAQTWDGGQVPAAGATVLVRSGHRVTYDVASDAALRAVHVSGTLAFAPDRDTRLDVGLLMVRPGESLAEDGIDGHLPGAHAGHGEGHARTAGHGNGAGHAGAAGHHDAAEGAEAAVEIGTPDRPIDAERRAIVRLVAIDGMDQTLFPALVASGGRLDLHGATMSRTWTKLGAPAKPGDATVTLTEAVTGWRPGDRIIVVTTEKLDLFETKNTIRPVRARTQTEERLVKSIDGVTLTLDKPLDYPHAAEGEFRGEVANLSRNVVVESADAKLSRGHTMYHKGSAGSISYAEFRGLGKEGVLGRYPIHFHQCGDTMRGSSVVGASVWDSGNRWVTVHGTEYLVVRDVVGYHSIGHGFFMEDGTEVYNVFDRNLAVQALHGKELPGQVMGFDKNDGAGFWWGNSLNTFTRNVAAECDTHGFRYEVLKDDQFDPALKVRRPDGKRAKIDVRTLPFVRFDDNEAHSQRRFGLNLGGIRSISSMADYTKPEEGTKFANAIESRIKGGDVGGVGPDRAHPFVIRDLKVWTTHWAFHGGTPAVLIDGLKVHDSNYGIWRSRVDLNEYRDVSLTKIARVDIFYPWGGNDDIGDDYDKFLRPIDDLPPMTVVTRVERTADGGLRVRGTTSDNGKVKDVRVNDRLASPTRDNYAEWEVVLAAADARGGTVTAGGTDATGNVERTPHARRAARLIRPRPRPPHREPAPDSRVRTLVSRGRKPADLPATTRKTEPCFRKTCPDVTGTNRPTER